MLLVLYKVRVELLRVGVAVVVHVVVAVVLLHFIYIQRFGYCSCECCDTHVTNNTCCVLER